MYVLDTSALLAHWYKQPGCDKVGLVLECEAYCSVLTLVEFLSAMRARKVSEPEREAVISSYDGVLDGWLDVDRKVASAAEVLRSRSSERIPGIDAVIAATALVHNAVLMHADSHFMALPAQLVRTIDIRDATSSLDISTIARETKAAYGMRRARSRK